MVFLLRHRKSEEWLDKSALTSSSLLSRMSWLSVRMQYFLSQTQGSVKGDCPQEKWWLAGPFTSVHTGQKRHLRMGSQAREPPQKQTLFILAHSHQTQTSGLSAAFNWTTFSFTSRRNRHGPSERNKLAPLLYLITSSLYTKIDGRQWCRSEENESRRTH